MKLEELLSPELFAQVKAAIDAKNAAEPDKAKHIRFADLSEGGYVSVDKHNGRVNTLSQQVTDLQGQIDQRKADIADLQAKLTAAQADATKLGDVQTALSGLQTKYDTEKQEWEQKIARQAYEHLVREKAGEISFTSAAAKRDFIREVTEKSLKVDGETLLGYEDVLSQYKAGNPGAIKEPEPAPTPAPATPPQPAIVLPNSGGTPSGHKGLLDLMKAKNENPNMQISFDAQKK